MGRRIGFESQYPVLSALLSEFLDQSSHGKGRMGPNPGGWWEHHKAPVPTPNCGAHQKDGAGLLGNLDARRSTTVKISAFPSFSLT
jgi:hypothetical protein